MAASDSCSDPRTVAPVGLTVREASPSRAESVLCLGLDIAWWGGSRSNPDSQHDCLAWAHLLPGLPPVVGCERIRLVGQDSHAEQSLALVRRVLGAHPARRVVFGVDAPLQAAARPHLPARSPAPRAGSVARRACEDLLSRSRQAIDKARGGTRGFHPNIQPGAPLVPRVAAFRQGCEAMGFAAWTPENATAPRLLLECFPAEAIWATHASGRYPQEATVASVKSYKSRRKAILDPDQVARMVRGVLDPMARDTGLDGAWGRIVGHCLDWMMQDKSWQTEPGRYRGGKLLDDVVDTLICLATAIGFRNGRAHVWHDPDHADDGHIAGPGPIPPG